MTPSKQCKAAGLKNLAEVCDMTGVSPQTMNNWAAEKPKLFAVIIAGCQAIKSSEFIFSSEAKAIVGATHTNVVLSQTAQAEKLNQT